MAQPAGSAGLAEPGGQEGPAPAWPIWSGPVPPLADGFTVRSDTVPDLEAALVPGAAVALFSTPPLPGPPAGESSQARGQGPADWRGPTGKTQLARHLAESLWRSPGLDVLAWVVASSRASVLDGFAQAAAAIGAGDAGDAESAAARFVDWLGKTARPWLVVLDDLRDAADLQDLRPAGAAGRLLITTANPAAIPPGCRRLAVAAFSNREAMSYLSGRLTADPDQRSGAIDLVGELGCEPMALAQASAVIASSGMSCRDYRQYFTQRQKQLAEAGRAEPSAAAVSWTFSAEYAEHLSPEVSIRALVTLAALLDGHGIPGVVFTTRAAGQYLMADAIPGDPPDPQRIWNAVLSLKQAGLLTVDPPGTPPAVRISPVIQAAIRTAVPKDVYERAVRAAADALLEVWPREEPRSRLAADLRACAMSLRQAGADLLWADNGSHPLLMQAGQSLDAARLTGPAVAYWRGLATDSERLLGPASLETLAMYACLGEALAAAGQPAEAVACFQRVRDGRAGLLGPDHPAVIAVKVSLGRAMVAVGRPDDAARVLEEAVAGSELVRGADHLDTTAAREEYAAAAQAAGRAAEAVRAYRQAHADRERIQGPEHPDTLHAHNSLAAAYFTAGRMGSALQLYEEACAGYERTIGADHPTTLACRAELARGYYVTGRLGDALTMLNDIIARGERALPPGDPLTQRMRETLASITG